MELPSFTDIPSGITEQALDVIDYIGKKIAQNTIDWASIVGYSADLKNAATAYFSSSAGQANEALTRIFKPARVYEYGCFQSYWTGAPAADSAAPRSSLTPAAAAARVRVRVRRWPVHRSHEEGQDLRPHHGRHLLRLGAVHAELRLHPALHRQLPLGGRSVGRCERRSERRAEDRQ